MSKIRIAVFIGLFLVLGGKLSAQSYRIEGKVLFSSDSLSIANVKLYDHANKLITKTISTPEGIFSLEDIKGGKYTLVVSSIGYTDDTLFVEKLSKDLNVGFLHLLPTSINLDEVMVRAKNIVNKNGVKYVYPTQSQLKNTTDAMILIDKMNLPRLRVDINTKTVSVNEGGVVFCVNGREVSGRELAVLSPKDIIRIEYHDIPEARYNYAAVVLDFITRQAIAGGSIYTSIWQGLLTPFGENNIATKVNHQNSEFSVNYYLAYRDWDKLSRDNNETFHLSDYTIHRVEKGIPAKFVYQNHSLQLNYNYQKDRRVFNIAVNTNIGNQPHRDWNSKLYASQESAPTIMTDLSDNKSIVPSINIYYQQPISSNQLLIFNVAGVYSKNDYRRHYKEERQQINLSDLMSSVEEEQNAYQISALYENRFKKGTFSAGINHKQSFTTDYYDIIYNQNIDYNTSKLRFRNIYAYAQWGAQIKKLYYRIGLGINFSQSKSGNRDYDYYTLKPSLSLRYYLNDNFELNYYGSINDTPPNLSSLSDYSQRIDSIQIQKGNPNLKREVNYYNALSLGANMKKWGVNLYMNHTYQHNPIMEATYMENNNVIRTKENHKSFQMYNAEIELRGKPFKDFIILSAYTGVKHFISRGNSYSHNYNNYYYGGRVNCYYKRFSLSWSIQQNARNSFLGETLSKYEDGHMLTFAYGTDKYRVAIDALNLFATRHINAKENYSEVAPYFRYEYLKETKNLVRINFVYNFSFGKKYKASRRALQGDSSIDSGILKGEK